MHCLKVCVVLVLLLAVASGFGNLPRVSKQQSKLNTNSKQQQAAPKAPLMTMSQSQTRWTPHATIRPSVGKGPDFVAAFSYVSATALQVSLLIAFLHFMQLSFLPNLLPSIAAFVKLHSGISLPPLVKLQKGVVAFLFLFLSLRSRIFSPLDNSRPRANKNDPVFKNRLRPWWQPPPLAFPLIWSTIALLRTWSSVIIYTTTNSLLTVPHFALMCHLSTGDTWNTINNVEARLGTAALVVPLVLATAAYTTYEYSKVSLFAAKVLSPSVAWLAVANLLVFSIYRLNFERAGRPSLFPSKEEGPPSRWRLPIINK